MSHGLPVRNEKGRASCPDCGEELPEATDGGVYTDLSPCVVPRALCRRCGESIRTKNLKDGFCLDCVQEMTDE